MRIANRYGPTIIRFGTRAYSGDRPGRRILVDYPRQFVVRWCDTQDQVANTLTAAEDRQRFVRNRDIMLN